MKFDLSSAVLEGIRSIRDPCAFVVVMDADLQHPPSKVDEIFEELKRFDFVEGARNHKGSMPLHRRLISDVAACLTKSLLPETKVLKDPMTGFFGFRMDKVDLSRVKPVGYKIGLELFMSLKSKDGVGHVFYDFFMGRRWAFFVLIPQLWVR